VAVQVEEVEGEEDDLLAALAERVLKGLEAGGSVGEEDCGLAVEERLLCRQRRDGLGHGAEEVGPFLAVAGDDADLPILQLAEHPVAVELELVNPLRACGRVGDQGGELGRDFRGELRLAGAGRGRGGVG
jgi:hypothetical protein